MLSSKAISAAPGDRRRGRQDAPGTNAVSKISPTGSGPAAAWLPKDAAVRFGSGRPSAPPQRQRLGKRPDQAGRIKNGVFVGKVIRACLYQRRREVSLAAKGASGDDYGAALPAGDSRMDKQMVCGPLRDLPVQVRLKRV